MSPKAASAENKSDGRASARRIGAKTSKTRDHLLNCVERLMVRTGYGSVTYRAVASEAGVTSGLVQYYFPSHDDLFVAVIRRRARQNIDRLADALRVAGNEPLRALWEYSQDESESAMTTEFLALGNHHESVRAEIAAVTEEVRQLQLQVLREQFGNEGIELGRISPEAFLFLLTGTPKLIRLEEGVGVSTTHGETKAAFESFFDRREPKRKRKKKKTVRRR
jgi:TetR/AcrR family transcriptional regulator, transcriptional repressor for nem operon